MSVPESSSSSATASVSPSRCGICAVGIPTCLNGARTSGNERAGNAGLRLSEMPSLVPQHGLALLLGWHPLGADTAGRQVKHNPMRSKGKRGLENDKVRQHVWPAVLKRARRRCEGCGLDVPVEWAHLFGRPGSGYCLGAIANSVELTAALCRVCHNGVDRGTATKLANELRWAAMGRLVTTLAGKYSEGAPYEGIRVVIAEAERTGWSFDMETYKIVRTA